MNMLQKSKQIIQNDNFVKIPQEKQEFPTLDQQLEQLWDEYADEMGYERKGDYVVKHSESKTLYAELSDEIKQRIYESLMCLR